MTTPHPPHRAVVRPSGLPARPLEDTSPVWRWRRRRACRRAGGHWWHPADAMIEWFCCSCGTSTDGLPTDGPGPLRRALARLTAPRPARVRQPRRSCGDALWDWLEDLIGADR